MRTAIMPPDGDGQESQNMLMLLRLPQPVWDTLSELARRRRCDRREVLGDAIMAGLLRLQTEQDHADKMGTNRPAGVRALMRLPALLVSCENQDGVD